MARYGIPTNDQYTPHTPVMQEQLMQPNNVHFKYQGYAALAKGVAEVVLGALDGLSDSHQVECSKHS